MENNSEKYLQKSINELFNSVIEYRSTKQFAKILRFISTHKNHDPFNASLLQLQKPSAQLILTIKQWKHYNRQPKPNAQTLIKLTPFGPVTCVYDFEDTEIINEELTIGKNLSQIYDLIYNIFETKDINVFKHSVRNNLFYNLPLLGIVVRPCEIWSKTCAAQLEYYNGEDVNVASYGEEPIQMKCRFLITYNSKLSETQRLASIFHELAHLFCRHLFYDQKKIRTLDINIKEFEAETIAHLICQRQNVHSKPDEYLAYYTDDDLIPQCNISMILDCVGNIEKLITRHINFKDSIWYKHDDFVRNKYNAIMENRKMQGK